MSELGRAHFEWGLAIGCGSHEKMQCLLPKRGAVEKPLSRNPSLPISTAGFLSLTFSTCSIQ